LAFLADVELSTLVARLREEHPQTVAIILASVPPSLAADLVPNLGVELKSEAMRRLSKLALPPPEVMQDIAAQLRSRLCSIPQRSDDALSSLFEAESLEASQSTPLGMASLSAILEEMSQAQPRATGAGKGSSGKHFQGGRSVAEPAAIRPQDRLIGAEPWRLREALAMVDGRQAVLAVCGLPPSVAEALLGSLPRKQVRQVRKQIANLGRLELREIDQAQALVARHLDAFDRLHGEAEHDADEGLARARQAPTKLAGAA
jgi:flagellar motor switch protein FliG